MTPDHEVVVVGAGFAGIGTSIALQRAGFEDHVLIEEGDDLGGTWHWNTYPGVAVDIPAYSYQFSFERMPDWSRVYAPGRELKAYADHCADKYDVRRRVRFGTRVEGAVFDEDEHVWRITTSRGEVTARYTVGATGPLNIPKKPDIPGLASFAGPTVHTARWDHTLDLKGKRVAIIGTGASAVQVIPEVAKEVEQLVVFQRTPIWCMPKIDGSVPEGLKKLMRLPLGDLGPRLLSQAFVEATFVLPAHFNGVVPVSKYGERVGRKFLRDEVHDPVVRDKLTPRYGLGCKRPGFHNEYLSTFNRDNVFLETAPITEIDAAGIVTADGRHDVDVLLLATGFKMFEKGNMPAVAITGRDGVDLEEWWRENRFQAYGGASIPGFPNFFAILGPYAYNGSSYFNLIETQSRHIVRLLKRARREGATTVEVRREAHDRFFKQMLKRRDNQIFFQDTCGLANSYYFDPHGDVPLRASTSAEVAWRSARSDLDDYRFAA